MPTKRLYCPKCGHETDGHVPVPGVQHRLCPSCKLEHLLEDDGGGRRVARMTDDFRQCRRCGKWFISGEYSNEPCLACVTKEMAKLTNIRERCAVCGTELVIYSEETGDVVDPVCPGCGSNVDARRALFLKRSAAAKEKANKSLLADMLKEDVNYYAKLEAEPAPPDGATGGMITLSAGKGTAAEAGVFEFRSTADRIRVNAATGQVEISRAGGEWAPFAELPAQAREQTAAPQQAAEPEARPRRRFRLEDDEKE